jgi:hypothetical protein
LTTPETKEEGELSTLWHDSMEDPSSHFLASEDEEEVIWVGVVDLDLMSHDVEEAVEVGVDLSWGDRRPRATHHCDQGCGEASFYRIDGSGTRKDMRLKARPSL